jgi:hypothetical protein
MLKTIARVCQIAFLVVATAALAWFLAGKLAGERRREFDPFERLLVARVVDRVVDALPRRYDVKRVLVLPVKDDPDQYVTSELNRALRDRREYVFYDAREQGPSGVPTGLDDAVKRALKLKEDIRPDAILHSAVRMNVPRDGVGAEVALESHLVPLPEKKEESAAEKARRLAAYVFPDYVEAKAAELPDGPAIEATERIDSRLSLDWFACRMEEASAIGRIAIWVLLAAGLPFAFYPVVQAVTRKENNRLNAAMLTTFVLTNMAGAAVLMGLRPGILGWIAVLAAGAVGFVYDFIICDRIDEMRK